jgi:putative tryptophan/tyrosine transport system substrate-binding protein
MTYGPNVRTLYRSLAGYADRILRGTAPADLPFQAPTKSLSRDQSKDCQSARPRSAPDLATRTDEVIELKCAIAFTCL